MSINDFKRIKILGRGSFGCAVLCERKSDGTKVRSAIDCQLKLPNKLYSCYQIRLEHKWLMRLLGMPLFAFWKYNVCYYGNIQTNSTTTGCHQGNRYGEDAVSRTRCCSTRSKSSHVAWSPQYCQMPRVICRWQVRKHKPMIASLIASN